MPNWCYFSRKRFNTTPKKNQLVLGVFLLISVLTIFIVFFRNHVKKAADCWPPLYSQSSATGALTVECPGKELPLCTGNLLDKREHRYAKEADGSYDNSRMISKSGSCQLMRYTSERVVSCFDALYERRYSARNFSNYLINTPKKLHLAFIGIAVWHMMQNQGADFKHYQKKLTELAPILGQLANLSQVIWLNQYPTVEFFGNIDASNSDIHSGKIHHYNQAFRQILGHHKSVRIWDSSNPLAEEYVRACAFSERVQYAFLDGSDSFFNYKDFTHTGFSALSQATQLLFNDICNDQKLNHMTLE